MGHVINQLWQTARANPRLIQMTFEMFWIVVFLLDRLGQSGAGGVPQFVYVNF
jgi:hypothetical protein